MHFKSEHILVRGVSCWLQACGRKEFHARREGNDFASGEGGRGVRMLPWAENFHKSFNILPQLLRPYQNCVTIDEPGCDAKFVLSCLLVPFFRNNIQL